MSNSQKILDTLARFGPLDDDKLSQVSDVRPRQQVNQICNRLRQQGLVIRYASSSGKLVNALSSGPRAASVSVREKIFTPKMFAKAPVHPEIKGGILGAVTPQKTLLIIPCSAAKSDLNDNSSSRHLADDLPLALNQSLLGARRALAACSQLNESSFCPAWRRYTGQFYNNCRHGLDLALKQEFPVLILSGGYGVVWADEVIGTYEQRFHVPDWPPQLLEKVIAYIVNRLSIKAVRAFVSATTDYGKLVRRVPWQGTTANEVLLIAPEATTGAMVKAPRAQGQALEAMVLGTLTSDWRSIDGLRLSVTSLR